MNPFTAAEYFAGIGLFRMGLENAGWKVKYANDWDPYRERVYEGFFGDSYEVRDVFSVGAEDVPRTTLATCSFPCIDLSLAGNRGGLDGKHSSAFWGFYGILWQQGSDSPPIILLENVGGWLSSNHGQDFYAVAEALNELGYACDAFTLNARCFVPQSRPRVFMVGIKDPQLFSGRDINADRIYFRPKRLLPTKLKELMCNNDRIHWAHLDIPEPPLHKTQGFSEEIVEKLLPDDPRWWSSEKVEKHIGMMPPLHLDMVRRLADANRITARTFYRRRRPTGQKAEVRSDDIAGCLRTAVGGSGKQFMVVAGHDSIRMRTLTAREYARLQGVRDHFHIKGDSERQSLNAFGDAVCVPAVTWIADNVLNPLAQSFNPD
jgi:DNA (cytosine-5)-methyltransferase 1